MTFGLSGVQVEHVVREEKTMAAYDLVEIYCELIAARLPMIESQKYLNHYFLFSTFYFVYFFSYHLAQLSSLFTNVFAILGRGNINFSFSPIVRVFQPNVRSL